RLRAAGSSGGHNGLESILEVLGTEQVPRLRVGIGRPPDQMVVEWVLGYPSLADRQALEAVVPQAVAVLDTLIVKGFDAAQRLAAAGGSGVEAAPDR
ncbi:MAG: aminoacyl-tRNA hydrolase, partial [Acidimicrobiales bacterium]